MKCSESWLREWVNPDVTREALCSMLTMAGLEVEELVPIRGSELAQSVSNDKQDDYLDYLIDIAITPNRGDCLSVRGLAREVSALTNWPLNKVLIPHIHPKSHDTLPIHIQAKAACPRYLGRIIRNVKTNIKTPDWLRDRLFCSGMKTISPIVDVTNYVMIELGQPMHAFDLHAIKNKIDVRFSKKGEVITLLDGSLKELDEETLLIADQEKPLAIAGVMGGESSSVTSLTHDILLESAYFSPSVVARQRQYYALNSDSSYRFERGVDSTIQRQAIERATQLILEIVGGEVGPVMEVASKEHLPKVNRISLTADKIKQILGLAVPNEKVDAIFEALDFVFKRMGNKWFVQTPLHRTDLAIPEDLIEEIARLHGYEKIPVSHIHAELGVNKIADIVTDWQPLRQQLCHQGYHEIISYSFVDKTLQTLLNPDEPLCELQNPITTDMTVMRTNLWPGLVNAWLYNKNRQQNRVRLFEIGTCFITRDGKWNELPHVAGLITGPCFPLQWAVKSPDVDFYDLKGNVEHILGMSYSLMDCVFKPDVHPALHPGQTAAIFYQNKKMGVLGALHPSLLQVLGVSGQVFVFELDLKGLRTALPTHFYEISKFPEIRRDIAILIKRTVPAKAIQDTIRTVAGSWLKDIFIFDVYQGKGVSPGFKSIALALIWQHPMRTLIDDEVTARMNSVITALMDQLGAELRS